jgi:hypothetical protein
MIVGSRKSHRIVLGQSELHFCQTCGQQRRFQLTLTYIEWRLYWIFGIVTSRGYQMLCEVCRKGWKLEIQKVEPFLPRPVIPFMQRFGLFTLIGGLAILIAVLNMT